MTRAITTLILCLTGVFAYGTEVRLVAPDTSLEDEDGNHVWTDATAPVRSQSLFFASQFSSLPPGHDTIVGYALRLDGAVTESVVVSWDYMRLTMATTNQTGLTTDFASNYGSDPVVVFEGPATENYQVSETAPPQPFWSPFFRFQTPFKYNPSTDGSLLFEFATTSGADSSYRFDVETSTGPTTFVIADSPTASEATFTASANMVTAFFFVPEPSGITLFLGAIGALSIIASSRRTELFRI